MNQLFVDTNYLVALISLNDQLHAQAAELESEYADRTLVTTENILIELLNFYCEQGDHTRRRVSDFVRHILLDIRVSVVTHGTTTFLDALDLYESRLDKGYSLTDCISMNVCRELGIKEVLTSDRHFEQEGFSVLL
ncbi:MAG: PIN domain-containing protein [Pyrinomonadaceae bacterium]|nr:PIN domain-containing protein [Pyrinomonadaceae bacterium]